MHVQGAVAMRDKKFVMHDNSVDFEEIWRLSLKDKNNTDADGPIDEINTCDGTEHSTGKTLLHHATSRGDSAMTQYFIDKGYNVNAKDNVEDTPLLKAIYTKSISTIKILLNANAKLESFDTKIGYSLLSILKYKSSEDLIILKMILDHVIRDGFDHYDKAQKLLDTHCPFPAVIILGNAELTKLLLERDCTVDERLIGSQETALHLAVHFLDIENVKVLLDHGAAIDAEDSNGRTPILYFELHPKDANEKLEILELLLDRGASLTSKVKWSELTVAGTLLRSADERTVQMIIPRIDLFRRNVDNEMLLTEMAFNEYLGVFDILKTLYFNENVRDHDRTKLLYIAASLSHVNKVRYFLDNGISINDDSGKAILEDIVFFSEYKPETREVLDLLLQYGANVQLIFSDKAKVNLILVERFDFVKPLLAHLAMIVSFYEPLMENVYENIESVDAFIGYFNLCKFQIEAMQNITVYEFVTLHELLRMDKHNVKMYARNREFVSAYEIIIQNNKSMLHSYYFSTLQLHVGEMISLEKLKRKVTHIICRITRLPNSLSRTVVYNIVEYFSHKDLENMLKV